MSLHFIHSGDLGDVLYSLPVVKAAGGGVIHLSDLSLGQLHRMTPERAALLAPLLEAQPYVERVEYGTDSIPDGALVYDLNRFRSAGHDLHRTNIAVMFARTFNLPDETAHEPWLTVPPAMRGRAVIFARSARYHNPRFPWKQVMERYVRHAWFIGLPAEHAAFVQAFGDVPYLRTDNLLHAAQVIHSSLLFVGNQSAPLAIANGLHVNTVCEVCPHCPNCLFPRPNFWAGHDKSAHLPDLEELIHGEAFHSKRDQAPRSVA